MTRDQLLDKVDEIINWNVNCHDARRCIDKALCQEGCHNKKEAAKQIISFLENNFEKISSIISKKQ